MTHKTNISIVAKYVDMDTSCIGVAMDNTSSNVCHIDLDLSCYLVFLLWGMFKGLFESWIRINLRVVWGQGGGGGRGVTPGV